MKNKLLEYVNDINANITLLESRGPYSKYEINDEKKSRGRLELIFLGHHMEGIACSLDSDGFRWVFVTKR